MSKLKIPLVDLRAQYRTLKPAIDEAIARVIANSSFVLGEEVETFEREFAAYCDTAFCIGCGNGTDALALALQAAGVGPGDEVITVSHTFIATAEAITDVGARAVFVDVCEETLLMDVSQLAAAITPKTRAIVPVHLYGQMVDMDPLMQVARARGLRVIEDAAQAHGARYKGRRAGSIGDLATFSFYPGKNLGAYGDAGAIVTSDARAAQWLRKARDHGRATKYEHDFESRNSRMDGIQGAVLRTKLRHLDRWNMQRGYLAAEYDRAFASVPGVRPVVVSAECEPVYHLYVVRTANRDATVKRLHEAGVGAGVHYPVPLHLQKAYAYLGVADGSLPKTEAACHEVLSLPIFPELDPSALWTIAQMLK